MRNVKKCILFTVIISILLFSTVYAGPLDDILNHTYGQNGFVTSMGASSGAANAPSDITGTLSNPGGWLADIINSLIGIISGGIFWPIFALFGIDNISRIIFNGMDVFRLSFFDTSVSGSIANGLLNAIAPVYVAFRYIAIICYVVTILYLAIRMLLSTVGKQKAMYKELIKHWVTGVLILLGYQWFMAYTILLSDTLVEILAQAIGYGSSVGSDFFGNSLGSWATVNGMGVLAGPYMICLLGMTIAVVWAYTKRLFTVSLLIMIFPLITITYVFDKIGDRKSQILSAWTKEFASNVFMQPIQAIALILIMIGIQAVDNSIIAFSPMLQSILKLVLLFMLFPAEKLVKKLFDVQPGINGGGMAGAGAGLMTSMMMINKAAPILGNNVKNFKDVKVASKSLDAMKAKGLDQAKIAEQEKKVKAMKNRAVGELTFGTGGMLMGMGATGSLSKGMAIGALADKAAGWTGDKMAGFSTKGAINEEFDSLIGAVEKGKKLSAAQQKDIASKLGMSTSELDRELGKAGGKDNILKQLKDVKSDKLDMIAHGADYVADQRAIRAASEKLSSSGKFADGSDLTAILMSKSNITGMSGDEIKGRILDKDGNAIKHSKFSDGKEVLYGVNANGPEKITLCADQEEKARSKARESTLLAADLMHKPETEQEAYLASDEGKKAYNRNYTKAREEEVRVVEELREATGCQTLQITSVSDNTSVPPAPPVQGPPPPSGGGSGAGAPPPPPNSPPSGAAAPVAAAVTVNTEEITRAISDAIQASFTSAGNAVSSSMSSELKSVIEGIKPAMQNFTPGSGVTLDSEIRSALAGVSSEMASTLQAAANDYTRAVSEAQNNAANYLHMFGASTDYSSKDAAASVQISYSEQAMSKIEESRVARRKAGLDAI